MAEGARITIDAQLQFRHDVEANWLAADPILKVGEPAYTIGYSDRFKLGDGQSKWSELPYLQLGEGGGGGGSQAYESLAWSAIKTLSSGSASVLAQAYAVKQAYTELKSLIPNLADYYTKEQINALIPSLEGYATESFVNTKIADLINGAPTTLDTLKEIADAFAASQDVIEALDEAIGKKANQSDLTALAARVAANEGNIRSLSNNKLDKSVWDSVFEIDAKGNLRAKVGIYSTSFISARTSDPSAGGGSGGGAFSLYTWDQVKAMTAEVGGVAPTAYALKQAYNELINATPTLSWNNIQDKPIFATVATSGSYSDLIGRPTALSDLANDVGYITSSAIPTSYAWSAITGKPDFAAVATSGSYNDLRNKPTIPSIAGLASESWVSNNFLGLGGGTITSASGDLFAINRTSGNPQVRYEVNGSLLGYIGMTSGNAVVRFTDSTYHTLIHSGNIGSQSVNYANDAARLSKTWIEDCNYSNGSNLKIISNPSSTAGNFAGGYQSGLSVMSDYVGWQLTSYGGGEQNPYFRSYQDNGTWKPWRQLAFLDDNVASATKLQTARTIWGQSFDGTGNVSGNLSLGNGGILGGVSSVNMLYYDTSNTLYLGYGMNGVGGSVICGNAIAMHYGSSRDMGFLLNSAGNVGIGTDSPAYPLDVNGHIAGHEIYSFSGWMTLLGTENVSYSTYLDNKNQYGLKIHYSNGIAGAFFSQDGNTYFYGNITASGTIYSAVGLYTPGFLSARSTAGSSDRNLKTNIAPVRNALAYILGTNYVSFDWKDTGEHSVGIIAQEELSREWSCLVQKYGKHYSYQYTQHTALLGSALQEEDKKVEALKTEVVTLKNKVQKLERQLWQQ